MFTSYCCRTLSVFTFTIYQRRGDFRGHGNLPSIGETHRVRCVAPARHWRFPSMACRGIAPTRFFACAILVLISTFDSVGTLSLFLGQALAEEAVEYRNHTSAQNLDGAKKYQQDSVNWNRRGRTVPGPDSPAALRFRAQQQKMAMRTRRTAANVASSSTVWTAVGPAPLASDATGDGMQDYNWVSGRATSVLIDPADSTGNTVLLGGAYGGLWKSTNAGSQSTTPASVIWQSLIDDEPTLAVGAIALQPGNSNVILVGTGETNSSTDSYYGLGILRSANGGATWAPPIQTAGTGQSFQGVGFSKIAFSTANPNLVVAATAGDNGLYLGLEEDANSTARGLYFSHDAGATWNAVILSDGAVPASATSVIYNAIQGAPTGTFYAFIRRHGLYSSTDGQHFTRMSTQPTPGLTTANCPSASNASSCPIYRGEFAVVPGRSEMYVWVVDVQPDQNGNPAAVDEGIWRSTNGGTNWTQIPDNGITNCGDDAFGPNNSGCGVEQGWYNLALAAVPDSSGTDVYAGAINLYKCTLGSGGTTCTQGDWINLTHVYGCNPGPLGAPAHVHPEQHGIAFMVVSGKAPGYFVHDGGISRTLDGYSGLDTGSCSGTNQFDSLSQTLGSMIEFVSISLHPTNPDILLGGAQNDGSPTSSTATGSSTFQNALGGAGGLTAINPSNPNEWFASNPYLTIVKCELGTACNDASFLEVVSSANLGGDNGAFFTPYILDPQNSGEMLVGTCRVWRVSTSGTSPLQLSNDFETLGTGLCTGDEINLVNAIAAGGPQDANGNSTVIYAVTNGYGPLSGSPGGEVWVTTQAGTTLMTNVTQNVNPEGYAISTVAMDSSDATGNTAYVGIMGFSTQAFSTSHIWKTSSAGTDWTDWTGSGVTGLPDNPVNTLLVDTQAGVIYAGTDVGVFVSSTTSASWTEVGPMPGPGVSGFLPNAPVTALQMFNPDAGTKTLVASTYGRGIWNFALVTSAGYKNAISNSPQTIFPTQSAAFEGTLTAQDGYASPVNLSCSGALPATCGVQPQQLTPTATYTLTAGGGVGDYSFDAHAVGTDPAAITRDATVTLHVVDFNLTAPNPNSLTVAQGGTSGASLFQVTASGSFAQTVFLSCPTGLPAGAACVFSPSGTVSPTSSMPVTVSLTVTAASGTPAGSPDLATISAIATGAPSAKTQNFDLTVTTAALDFTWSDTSNAAVTVLAGQTANYTFSMVPAGGTALAAAMSFACGGLPALTTCEFAPATLAAGAGTTSVALTITTAGPNLGTGSGSRIRPASGLSPVITTPRRRTALSLSPLLAIVWGFVVGMIALAPNQPGRRRSRQRRYAIAWVFLAAAMIGTVSCGGIASVGIVPPPPATVTVNPGLATLFADESGNAWPVTTTQEQFMATVNGSSNQNVTWAVTGGNANGTVDSTGLYTAPAIIPSPATITVTATSPVATAPGSAFVNIATPTALGVSQITVTATEAGGASHSNTVTLTVQ
jgi:hypothetical protein